MNDNKIRSFPEYETLLKKELKKRNIKFAIFSFLNSVAFLILGIFLVFNVLPQGKLLNTKDENYRKLMQVYEIISQNWYFGEDGDETDFVERALLAMINDQNEDDYLTYFPASSTENDYGLGIVVNYFDGYLLISDVYENSSSFGELFKGDIITKIDNIDIRFKTLNEIVSLIRGPKDEEVKLEVVRQSVVLQKTIVRKASSKKTASGYSEEDYGVLKLTGFENDTVQLAKIELDIFKNNNVNNLIIDLRDNGGGYIMAFQALADLFTPKGSIFGVYKHKDSKDNYYAKGANSPRYSFENIIILINKNTASAAETFTAALMDSLDNVRVLGTTSYGKGIAQKTVVFEDGSQLRYTYAEYYRVNDVKLHQVGIIPEIEIKIEEPYQTLVTAFNEGETLLSKIVLYLIAKGYDSYLSDVEIIKAYQNDKGLALSGEIDKETLIKVMQDFYSERKAAEDNQIIESATYFG